MKPIQKSIINDFRHGIFLTLLALFAIYFFWPQLERMEYGLYDLSSRLRVKPAASPVSVIAIDERSISNFGPWPWPRSYIAFMIDMLDVYDAKVIGLDIIYSGKDLNHGLKEVVTIIKTIENNPQYSKKNISTVVLLAALKDAEQRLDNDTILANSIATSKKVVMPLLFHLKKSKETHYNFYTDYMTANSLFPYPSDKSVVARDITVPIDPFASDALRLGHINIFADNDGVVRSENFFINYNDRIYPSLALQLVLAYFDLDLTDLSFGKNLTFAHKSIPLLNQNRMLISYKDDIPYYSFIDVIDKKVPADEFRNKVVIIAPSTAGLGELRETAMAYKVPSVKIIANVIDNILSDDYIIRPEWAVALELMMIFLFGLFITLIIPRLGALFSTIITLAVLALWISASLYLFVNYSYWIKAVYPAFVLLMGHIIIVSKRYEVAPKT